MPTHIGAEIMHLRDNDVLSVWMKANILFHTCKWLLRVGVQNKVSHGIHHLDTAHHMAKQLRVLWLESCAGVRYCTFSPPINYSAQHFICFVARETKRMLTITLQQ